MPDLFEASREGKTLPGFEIVIGAVAGSLPAFFALAAGIGGEEYASRAKAFEEFAENPQDLLAGNVEQAGVCEYAVEVSGGELESQEIL